MISINDVVRIDQGTDLWVVHIIRKNVAKVGFLKGGPIVTISMEHLVKVNV